eukprot:TRINITY_DN30966_c0_g1_i1.p1 TRINITY_DN30966_c0_g1~~TRINITY_DN30966_c0_g1_i1.p1  ORF type:complete len:337 (+),score=52.31 TRINITY_DN30966_c0_g1_i1:102-1013(+)
MNCGPPGSLGAAAAAQMGPGWQPVQSTFERLPNGAYKESAVIQGPMVVNQVGPVPVQQGGWGHPYQSQAQWRPAPVSCPTTFPASQAPYGGPVPTGMAPPASMMQGGWQAGGGATSQMRAGNVTCDVFVEVMPTVSPTFDRGPNNSFVMTMQPFQCVIATSCTPAPPSATGLAPFHPQETLCVQIPEIQQVYFDPARDMPPQGVMNARVVKHGAVLEVPSGTGMNAQIKTNSPHGALVLEDYHEYNGYKQKVGETTLHYRLQVEGHLSVNKGGGNCGSDRLEVDLVFTWTCSVALQSNTVPPH